MWGVELVKDKGTKVPFDESVGATNLATMECIEHGLIIFPNTGMIDGNEGDNFLLVPPLVTTEAQMLEIMEKLPASLASTAKKLL